ncbi:MAG: putative Large-conductance mechanosensitive channel-like protein, partial [Candidatus Saccharibacteria bacterium]|nr:putative Large-conductance mechanosensitive channel-like protein [Candidatus Saccharibacteria bacterium]
MATRSRKRNKPEQVTVVTSGSTIRFEEPKSGRQPKTNAAVVVVQEKNPVTGFVGFLREHAVVGLAIGFIIGTQAQALVKLLIASFIDPAFQLLFGQALSQRTFTLHFHERTASFAWGGFAYGLLNFLFVLAAVYIIIKTLSLDKLDKPKE